MRDYRKNESLGQDLKRMVKNLHKIVAESVKVLLREQYDNEPFMDDEDDASEVENSIADSMINRMYAAALAEWRRADKLDRGQALDISREHMGDEAYIEALESMLMCL